MLKLFFVWLVTFLSLCVAQLDIDREPICFSTDVQNSTDEFADTLVVQPRLQPTCPYEMETAVFADTTKELKINRNYTYEIYFGNETKNIPTTYRFMFCNIDMVRWCNVLTDPRSRTAYIALPFEEWPEGQDTANMTISVGIPGKYALYGHVVQLVEDQYLSIAQPIHGFVLSMTDTPDPIILTNSKTFIITSITISVIYSLTMVAMLIYIIRNRKHPLLKLAQAPFLAVQMACAIIATASSFVFLPIYDVVCQLQGTLIHVPLTVLAATLVGRLWRAYVVIAVAMRVGRRGAMRKQPKYEKWTLNMLKVLANLHLLLQGKNPHKERQYTLRTQVSAWELSRLIIVLSTPQVLLQIFGIIFVPRHLVVDATSNGLIGRQVCSPDWIPFASMIYMNSIFILAVFVAWVGRDLPSMLNEKDPIFTAGAICIVLTFIAYLCVLVSAAPTTNPDVISIMWMMLTVGIVSSIVWLIMWPKIQRVREGGTVVVSNLLKSNKANSSSITGSVVNQATITLQMNSAPPRKIEVQMLHVKGLLTRLCRQSLSGTSIALGDWQQLIASVDILRNDLNRLEFAWSKSDEGKEAYDEDDDEEEEDSTPVEATPA